MLNELVQARNIGRVSGVHRQGADAPGEEQRTRQGVEQSGVFRIDGVRLQLGRDEIGKPVVDARHHSPPRGREHHPTRQRHGFRTHIIFYLSVDGLNIRP